MNDETTQPTTPGPSGRAILSLVFGLLALIPCCLFFAGIPAIVLGGCEQAAIAQGRAPKAGSTFASVGRVLGIIGTALGILFVLAWFLLIGIGFMAEGWS